jgi:hypothetical protein
MREKSNHTFPAVSSLTLGILFYDSIVYSNLFLVGSVWDLTEGG